MFRNLLSFSRKQVRRPYTPPPTPFLLSYHILFNLILLCYCGHATCLHSQIVGICDQKHLENEQPLTDSVLVILSARCPSGRLVKLGLCSVLVGQVLWQPPCHCSVPCSSLSPWGPPYASYFPEALLLLLLLLPSLWRAEEDASVFIWLHFRQQGPRCETRSAARLSAYSPQKLQCTSGSRLTQHKSAWPLTPDL